MIPKIDEIVLCKVKKIEGTTVFLDIVDSDVGGTMVLSEVAAGRIRNLRQHVSPGRLIVCKVLKISGDHIELSLRRVTARERDEVMENYKKQNALRSVLKFAGQNPEEIFVKIKKDLGWNDFFAEFDESAAVLERYVSKDVAKKIFEIFSEKEAREKTVEKQIKISSLAPNAVGEIKEILDIDAEIHYLGSSRFSIKTVAEDFKEANLKMQSILGLIEKRAKEKKAEFEILREK